MHGEDESTFSITEKKGGNSGIRPEGDADNQKSLFESSISQKSAEKGAVYNEN